MSYKIWRFLLMAIFFGIVIIENNSCKKPIPTWLIPNYGGPEFGPTITSENGQRYLTFTVIYQGSKEPASTQVRCIFSYVEFNEKNPPVINTKAQFCDAANGIKEGGETINECQRRWTNVQTFDTGLINPLSTATHIKKLRIGTEKEPGKSGCSDSAVLPCYGSATIYFPYPGPAKSTTLLVSWNEKGEVKSDYK